MKKGQTNIISVLGGLLMALLVLATFVGVIGMLSTSMGSTIGAPWNSIFNNISTVITFIGNQVPLIGIVFTFVVVLGALFMLRRSAGV